MLQTIFSLKYRNIIIITLLIVFYKIFFKASIKTLKNLFLLLYKGGVYIRKNNKYTKLI